MSRSAISHSDERLIKVQRGEVKSSGFKKWTKKDFINQKKNKLRNLRPCLAFVPQILQFTSSVVAFVCDISCTIFLLLLFAHCLVIFHLLLFLLYIFYYLYYFYYLFVASRDACAIDWALYGTKKLFVENLYEFFVLYRDTSICIFIDFAFVFSVSYFLIFFIYYFGIFLMLCFVCACCCWPRLMFVRLVGLLNRGMAKPLKQMGTKSNWSDGN